MSGGTTVGEVRRRGRPPRAVRRGGVQIGSGECNFHPLLRNVAALGEPVILSTGLNTMPSMRKAVAIFDEARVPGADCVPVSAVHQRVALP